MEALVGDGHEDRAILAREIINQGYLWARDEAAAEAVENRYHKISADGYRLRGDGRWIDRWSIPDADGLTRC